MPLMRSIIESHLKNVAFETLTVSSTDPCLMTVSLTANQTVRLMVRPSAFQGVHHAKKEAFVIAIRLVRPKCGEFCN